MILIGLMQGCTTQILWRAKKTSFKFQRIKRTKNPCSRGVFIKQTNSMQSILAFEGHIWSAGRMLCMPGLLDYKIFFLKIFSKCYNVITLEVRNLPHLNLTFMSNVMSNVISKVTTMKRNIYESLFCEKFQQ